MQHLPSYFGFFLHKQANFAKLVFLKYAIPYLLRSATQIFTTPVQGQFMRSPFFQLLAASLLGGLFSVALYHYMLAPGQSGMLISQPISFSGQHSFSSAPATDLSTGHLVPDGLNFLKAASKATPAVVHIRTSYTGPASAFGKNSIEELFRDFFGDEGGDYYGERGLRMSSGSGVIISEDGYIATNFHVIEGASKVEVTLNDKRKFEAQVVGTDPTTDLALLKVAQVNGLPFLEFGNSDVVQIGEWVLAVGNPFDLTSTVTAGIVSAKARNINILRTRDNLSIESFIQTDAAVNPGNSGGALVNLEGYLVGINTAIATNTGSFSGYSFAVPAILAKKVMEDLINYGEVQRALMGVAIINVDASLADRHQLGAIEGVFVASVSPGGGADEAGIRAGDVILKVQDVRVSTVSELQEQVARNRPGETIVITLRRKSQEMKVNVKLRNKHNTTDIVRSVPASAGEWIGPLGAELVPLSPAEQESYQIEAGLRVRKLKEGKLKDARVEEGFAITHIDNQKINSTEELQQALKDKKGGILIEGRYPDGQKAFYGIGF